MHEYEFETIKLANKLNPWKPEESSNLYEMTEDEYKSGGDAIDGLYTVLGELSEYKRESLEKLVDDIKLSNVEEVEHLVSSIVSEIKFIRLFTLIANLGLFAIGVVCGLLVTKFIG